MTELQELRHKIILHAFADLESTRCRCENWKPARKPFCHPCMKKLPDGRVRALSDRRSFPRNYVEALWSLGLTTEKKYNAAITAMDSL